MHTTRTAAFAGSALILCGSAPSAIAQIGFVSQSRSVSASTDGPDEMFSSAGLGLFEGDALSEFPDGSAFAAASQTSFLSPTEISGVGEGRGEQINAFRSVAESILEVTFLVDEPLEYTFVGSSGFAEVFLGAATVVLTGPDDFVTGIRPIFVGPGLDPDVINSIDETGVLQPGEYTLRAVAQRVPEPFGGQVNGRFDFSLTIVPAPGVVTLLIAGGVVGTRRRRA
ncbi:MAG: hypothetical protein AAGH64_12955 [Planctomycetota bacterium]